MSDTASVRFEDRSAGFARLGDYPAAMHPLDLRALLDSQPGEGERAETVRAGLTRPQRTALSVLTELRVPLLDPIPLRWRCQPDLAFALGLDRPAGGNRLGAMLARAFARADRYAAACADEAEIRTDVQPLLGALDRALRALGGVDGPLWVEGQAGTELDPGSTVRRALDSYTRMHWHREEVDRDLQDDIAAGLGAIERVREGLANLRDQGPVFGWPAGDEARFFFLLRLAEVFTLSTGLVPSFSGHRPKGPERAWTDFARAALDLTGLGTANFDELSRCLGGKRPERIKATIEEHYGSILTDMATWFAGTETPDRPGRPLDAATALALSVGRVINVKDWDEPRGWGDRGW